MNFFKTGDGFVGKDKTGVEYISYLNMKIKIVEQSNLETPSSEFQKRFIQRLRGPT